MRKLRGSVFVFQNLNLNQYFDIRIFLFHNFTTRYFPMQKLLRNKLNKMVKQITSESVTLASSSTTTMLKTKEVQRISKPMPMSKWKAIWMNTFRPLAEIELNRLAF